MHKLGGTAIVLSWNLTAWLVMVLGVRSALRVRGADCSAVECWFMGIQPTERGKQIKRPKGDLL